MGADLKCHLDERGIDIIHVFPEWRADPDRAVSID